METFELIAPCHFGLEAVLKREIQDLGYEVSLVEDGRVTFIGDAQAICQANIFLRTAERVLLKVGRFQAVTFDELFENIKALPWERYIPADGRFWVTKATSVKSQLFSPSDIQSIVKKAMVERLKESYKINWFPEEGAEYPVRITFLKDEATVGIDTSGISLHKRGYRQMTSKAPITETLAAALIMLTPWKKDRILVDPFCGCGTFPIEAAMMAANMAPGMNRTFTAEDWTNLIPKKHWYEAVTEANDLLDDTVTVDIQGYDIDPAQVRAARENAREAGVDHMIHFQARPVSELRHPKKYGFLITNPPYGERLEEKENLPGLYREIGEAIARLDSWSAYLITSYEEAERYIGRKADKNRKIYNGMLKTYFYQFLGPKPPRRQAYAYMGKIIKRGIWILFLAVLLVTAWEKLEYLRTDEAAEELGSMKQVFPKEMEEETREIVIEQIREDLDLPEAYDYRDEGRTAGVRDQGSFGTCWAFASLTALETTLTPEETLDFSRDHLNFQNHYLLTTEEGGSYIMAVAYLTAWQGPVLEEDDPYGDNYSPDGLEAVKHVQEVRMPDYKDYQAIKQTVYLYGGVETSLYMDFDSSQEASKYYNRENFSYCYAGEEEPNHDVVIIGWDDLYPAENFNVTVPGNGAFICQNSWGSSFGEDGVFYVSYYDTNIGIYNVAYIKAEEADNYDVLYQSDLCGWSGQVGYNTDSGCFANVYEAESDQVLRAVGFYATGPDTEYRLAVITDFEDSGSLQDLQYVQGGYLQYTGFYTVELDTPVELRSGERFAVAVQITTPDSVYPIAVEFASGELSAAVTLEDGEGYISPNGRKWERVEESQNSNLCLKAYADSLRKDMEEQEEEE